MWFFARTAAIVAVIAAYSPVRDETGASRAVVTAPTLAEALTLCGGSVCGPEGLARAARALGVTPETVAAALASGAIAGAAGVSPPTLQVSILPPARDTLSSEDRRVARSAASRRMP